MSQQPALIAPQWTREPMFFPGSKSVHIAASC